MIIGQPIKYHPRRTLPNLSAERKTARNYRRFTAKAEMGAIAFDVEGAGASAVAAGVGGYTVGVVGTIATSIAASQFGQNVLQDLDFGSAQNLLLHLTRF